MKPKLTKEQVEKIKELLKNQVTQVEIAKMFGVSQKTVSYWSNNDLKRKAISKKQIESFRKKPLDKRREIYKKRLPYLREYFRKRYGSDSLFREKVKLRVSKYYKSKRIKLVEQLKGGNNEK